MLLSMLVSLRLLFLFVFHFMFSVQSLLYMPISMLFILNYPAINFSLIPTPVTAPYPASIWHHRLQKILHLFHVNAKYKLSAPPAISASSLRCNT